jgi:hypothetical protein
MKTTILFLFIGFAGLSSTKAVLIKLIMQVHLLEYQTKNQGGVLKINDTITQDILLGQEFTSFNTR